MPEVDQSKERNAPCGYTADDVFNYSEDHAESISNPAMEQHLKVCKKCRDILDGFARVTDAAKKMGATTRPKPSKDARPPESIAGFKIVGEIAEGGMGKVYKAYDPSLDRFLALKVMKDELSDNTRFCERFIAEAQTLAKLNHPNVVVGHSVGRYEGQLYIAMEFVDGKSLLDKINRRQLTINESLQLFSQILEGIKVAHAHNIIHRDIKPANIMITSSGQIKILDFGLAKEVLLGTPAASMETGMLLGTLAYMAPEVAMGMKATKQSDVFALGVVLYQMLTNWIPFIDSPTPFALIERIKSEPLRPPSELNPAIPRSIDTMIMKMCAKRPEERYVSVDAVLRAFSDQPVKESAKQEPPRTAPWMENRGDNSKFYFCESCGKRVTDTDLETGAGKDKKLKGVYCALCAVGVMTMEFDAPAVKSPRASGTTTPAVSPGTRRPGSARVAAIASDKIPDRGTHGAKNPRVTRRDGSPTMAIVAGVCGAALLGVLALYFNSSKTRAPLPSETPPTQVAQVRENTKPIESPVTPPNPPVVPVAPVVPKESVKSSSQPVQTQPLTPTPPVEAPRKPDPEVLAKASYDELLKSLPTKNTADERSAAVNAFLKEYGDSSFAKSARELLNVAEKPAPAQIPVPVPVTTPASAESTAAPTKAAQKLFATVLKELAPLLNRNRFNDAEKLLDDKLRDPTLAGAAPLIKKEKSDLAELRLLRQRAVDALKAKKGTSVTLKIRGISMSGSVKDEPNRPDVALALRDGPEMTIKADQLDAQDVDTLAPAESGNAKGQDLWRRGLLFLAAGDATKAEDFFTKSRDAGFGDAAVYLQRLAAVKSDLRESAALEAWKKAETLFGNKNWKGAKQAYESFDREFAGLETQQSNADALKKRLEAIEEALGPPKSPSLELGGGIKVDLILISPGEFSMGSQEGEPVEKPVHKVKITKPFYIGKFPITQSQYEKIMGKNPSEFKGENLPVEMVKFSDAEEFCKKVSALTGKPVRLPNEGEWEYACRGGTSSRYASGEHEPDAEPLVWHKGNSENKTHPVGQKKPNPWGLYDMEGNVWEWCRDWFDGEYYAKSPPEDPLGPAQGTARVLRGGAWRCDVWDCRSAARLGGAPDAALSYIGFRVVVAVPKAP